MTRDLLFLAALVPACLWYGWASVERRAGQMCIAALSALALGVMMYL